MFSPRREAMIAAAVNGFVVAVFVGACVLAGFDAVNRASAGRYAQATVIRENTLAEIRALRAEVAEMKAER